MVTPPPTPRRPDHDERPSIRMRVAASMLHHGRDPHPVAEVTGVPLALVELIGEGLDPHPAASPPPEPTHPSHRTRARNDAVGADPHSQAAPTDVIQLIHAQVRHARRRTRIAVAALVCWVLNPGLSATADIAGVPALRVTSLILTPALVVLTAPTWAPTRPRPGWGRTPAMTTPEMLLRLATGLGLGALIGVKRQ